MKDFTLSCLNTIRDTAPLIHNITNFVVMNSSANTLLAMGASPVMAHSKDEVRDMVAMAGAVVLNIGTLTEDWVDAMILAGQKANEKNIPVILDPVGAGATPLRTRSVKRILDQCKVAVIRGNTSEIMALTDSSVQTKGVDSSLAQTDKTLARAMDLALKHRMVVAVSGPVDTLTDGKRIYHVNNGHPLMTRVTGMGCGLSAVTAAFCAVKPDDLLSATAGAFGYYGVCGELAAKVHSMPGSFFTAFLDCLYSVGEPEIERRLRVDGPLGGGL